MKRIIVIIVMLILLGGGGAGALIMMGIIPNPFNPMAKMSASEKAAAMAEASKKVYVPPDSVMTFVDLRDMIIPVVINEKVERKVYLSVRLRVVKAEKDAVENEIVRYESAVLDTFIPYFQSYFSRDHDLMDLVEIKKKLNQIGKKLYGEKLIDVMLINMFEQRFGTLE